ncbi:MAG: AMP nucleosidase [bacterium]|nr:AMP nucleosidase [bacterium]
MSIPAHDLQPFRDAKQAIKRIRDIYRDSIERNIRTFKEFAEGRFIQTPIDAFYPYLFITVENQTNQLDPRLSYGFVRGKGTFGTTITRPDLFHNYLEEQIGELVGLHGQPVYVGVSETPIPIHFSFPTDDNEFNEIIRKLDRERVEQIPNFFAVPDLSRINDDIANGTFKFNPQEPQPLSIFTAERVDISLQRLMHYTGTLPEHFQNFVLFTNYQFYVDEFIAYGKGLMERNRNAKTRKKRQVYSEFVEPGNRVTVNNNFDSAGRHGGKSDSTPPPQKQMPAYHLKRKDGNGVTLINIGVGPSNAKNITDHVAVIRPHCWLMLGHCAGLRQSQRLGDYVLAHGYLREDQVLDADIPTWIPLPPLAEVQQALQHAVAQCTGFSGYDLKKVMRTGTVATTSNRNWELEDTEVSTRRFSQSRAIAVDMESATIAANGMRFRVPYGTLLCVSDRPVHGELKLPGMANQFYRERVNQHLKIGLKSVESLRKSNLAQLHSRKLRTITEPAFR